MRCLGIVLATAFALAADGAGAGNPPGVNYALHCMGCHFADGAGVPGSIPPLKDFAGRFLHVEGGREFLVQVPGVAQSALDDRELAEVMNWMLREFSGAQLPVDFRPYTAAEIGDLRKTKLVDVTERREALILRFPSDE